MRGNVNNLSVEMFVCLFVCLFVFVQDKGDMIINECGSQNKQTNNNNNTLQSCYVHRKQVSVVVQYNGTAYEKISLA